MPLTLTKKLLKPLHLAALTLLILGSSFIVSIQAQTHADKSFYLIDSLDLSILTEADRHAIDSCLTVYHKVEHDTAKINAIHKICLKVHDVSWEEYQYIECELIKKSIASLSNNNPDNHLKQDSTLLRNLKKSLGEALFAIGVINNRHGDITKQLEFYNKALKIFEEIDEKASITHYLTSIGSWYKNQGDNTKALEYYLKALKISKEINDKKSLSVCFTKLGSLYLGQGNLSMALEYYLKSLKISEKIDNKNFLGSSLSSIGHIYLIQKNYPKALEYYNKAYKIYEQSPLPAPENKSAILSSIGTIYGLQENYTKALEYKKKSLKIIEGTSYKVGIAGSLKSLGINYRQLGDTIKAMEYFHKGLKIYEEIKSIAGISVSLYYIGDLNLMQGNLKTAEKNLSKSLKLAQELGRPFTISAAAEKLSKLAKLQGNKGVALEMYELHVQMRDSVNNQENQQAVIQQQFKYEYEKKKIMQKAETERLKLEQIQINNEKQAALDRKQTIQVAGICVFIVVLISFLLMLSKKKVNPKVLKFLGTFSVLVLFEFITVVLHPTITHITHHDLVLTLMCTVALASLVVPMHHKVEHYLVGKLVAEKKEVLPTPEKDIAEIEAEEVIADTKEENEEVIPDVKDERENDDVIEEKKDTDEKES